MGLARIRKELWPGLIFLMGLGSEFVGYFLVWLGFISWDWLIDVMSGYPGN